MLVAPGLAQASLSTGSRSHLLLGNCILRRLKRLLLVLYLLRPCSRASRDTCTSLYTGAGLLRPDAVLERKW